MTWFIGQSLPVIAAAFLLGLLVGWLWFGRRRPAIQPSIDTASTVDAAPEVAIQAEPAPSAVAPAVAAKAARTKPKAAPAEPVVPAQTIAAEAPREQLPSTEAVAVAEAVAVPAAPEVEPAAPEVVAAKPAKKAAKTATAPKKAAKKATGEDFRRIEGIGPKMSAALVAAGFTTYAELAEAEEQALRDAIEAAGLKFAPSLVNWARQAKLIVDGDEAGLEDLQRRLVAGRDTGRV